MAIIRRRQLVHAINEWNKKYCSEELKLKTRFEESSMVQIGNGEASIRPKLHLNVNLCSPTKFEQEFKQLSKNSHTPTSSTDGYFYNNKQNIETSLYDDEDPIFNYHIKQANSSSNESSPRTSERSST